jgi:Nif-specific regulatory protein
MDLKLVLGEVLKAMADNMGMMKGVVAILNREAGSIEIEEAYGLSKIQQARGRYKLGEGITGKVIESGKTMIVPKVSDDPLFLDKTRSRDEELKKNISFICVPIKLGHNIIGALNADKLFDENVSLEEDVKLMQIIASMIANAVHLRQHAKEDIERLKEENKRLSEELKDKFHPKNIIGNSKEMQEVYKLISKVLYGKTTVHIRGESGTGKELVANAIHYNSCRSDRPFVRVNCAAIPENLIESELFGHEKGAFTGALNTRKGKFEQADGGTIFLDEIGDLPLAAQTKLLRILQEREVERLGSNKSIGINVRVITGTNKNLEKLVEEGKFREDLYYRINVYPIHVPPLRERKADIILLTNCFIEKYSAQNHKIIHSVSSTALDMLVSYHWPGNVRELENCLERAILLANNGVIHGYHLPPSVRNETQFEDSNERSLAKTLESVEKELIIDALKACKGNIAKASKSLDVTERILGLRIKKYDINPKSL